MKTNNEIAKGPSSYENWKAWLEGVPMQVEFEYPLYTDAHLVGHDLIQGLGPYRILNCVNVFHRHRPALVLCAQHHLVYEPEVKLKTEDDAYHGGCLQDEIAALISLMLGIRLKAGEANREFGPDDPRGRPISHGFSEVDPIVPNTGNKLIVPNATGEHQLSDASLLSSLLELGPREVIALIRAARLYQEAIWIVESTPELSWLMLTSAIETAASIWRPSVESHEDSLRISRPKLVRLIQEHGGNDLVIKVADELAGTIGATRNFIDFIVLFLPAPPANRSYEWAQLKWDERSMKKSRGHRVRFDC
jgi:hypothetical protein